MVEYDGSTYSERIAAIYDDDLYRDVEDVDAMAEFLATLAKSGRALELGVGQRIPASESMYGFRTAPPW